MTKRSLLPLVSGLLATMLLSSVAVAQESVTVELEEQGGSGVSGTATLTDIGGGRTSVAIEVSTGGNPNMPAHIHSGSCENLGGVVYPLANVMDGQSTTEVDAPLAELGGMPMNLHLSPQQASVYVACGTIPMLVAAPTEAPPAEAPEAAPVAAPAPAGGPGAVLLASALGAAGIGLLGAGALLRRRRS